MKECSQDLPNLNIILNGSRCFRSLTLQYVTFDGTKFDSIPAEFLNDIKVLILHNCTISLEQFVHLILRLPNVDSLTIEFINFYCNFFESALTNQMLQNALNVWMEKLKKLNLFINKCEPSVFISIFGNLTSLEEFGIKMFPYPSNWHMIGAILDKILSWKKLKYRMK